MPHAITFMYIMRVVWCLDCRVWKLILVLVQLLALFCFPFPVALQIAAEAHSDDEALDGEDWVHAQFQPPSIEVAKDRFKESMFAEGEVRVSLVMAVVGITILSLSLLQASFCSVGLLDLSSMGVGISLYFRLIKYLGVFFLLATLCSFPAMLVMSSGDRVSEDDADALGLVRLTLGNLGPPAGVSLFPVGIPIALTLSFSVVCHHLLAGPLYVVRRSKPASEPYRVRC
jgi:hypothetical protein